MRIVILASIWCQNLWDELILKNEIKLLRKEFNNEKIEFIVFSYDKKNHFFEDEFVKYKEYFPIWIKNIKNIFRNIWNFFLFLHNSSKADIVVIWWWGIIYDKENQTTKSPLDLWVFRTKILRFFRKKIYFFRVWVDVKEEGSFKKLEKIFKNPYKITVRDPYSKEILESIWIKSEQTLDPVFFDNWERPEKTSCFRKRNSLKFSVSDLKDLDLSWKTIWLAFRSWYLAKKSNISDRVEEWKMKEILNYLTKNNAEVILLPHSFHKTDLKANDYIFLKKFVNKQKNIKIAKNMLEVYNFYKQRKMDFCISMRLHSMILLEVYKIPYISVSYSIKTTEVLKIF